MDKVDSHKVFTQRAVESCERKSQLPSEVQQCFRNGYFDSVINESKPEGKDLVLEKEVTATPIGVNRDQLLVARNHTISSVSFLSPPTSYHQRKIVNTSGHEGQMELASLFHGAE